MNTEIWTQKQTEQLKAINRLLGESSKQNSASGNKSAEAKNKQAKGSKAKPGNWLWSGAGLQETGTKAGLLRLGSAFDNLANDWGNRAGIYAGVIMGEWGAGWASGDWDWEEHAEGN